jgi:signal transduction histidine kinase
VNRIVVFFYVLTWVNLVYATYMAVIGTDDGDYGFLVPVVLYALLFVVHFALNYLVQYRRIGGTLSDLLWGYDEPAWRQYAFILANVALVFWMNSESPAYWSAYTPIIAVTFGMFRWQVALPLMALEIAALTYQVGILDFFDSAELPTGAIIGILIGVFMTVISFVLITVLLRSRIESEMLVQELKATKERLEEALLTEREVAVLRERNRMAREMHDVLGHALVLVAVKIEAAQRLQAVDPARAAAELDATKELVRQSMDDLRASLADLRSPDLQARSQRLGEALRAWTVLIAKENHLAIECHFEPGVEALSPPVEDALWRVGREAVLNAVKHARANRVEVNLFSKDGMVLLSVGDDGVGIPHLAEGEARLEVEGHYGIRGMRERLESLGGHLTLKPYRDGKGTLVLASVPLPLPHSAFRIPHSAFRNRERVG